MCLMAAFYPGPAVAPSAPDLYNDSVLKGSPGGGYTASEGVEEAL